ncbi:hypothetical protein [Oribacterium sp. WCC10]|uniref:hypothetical protein n=1 Tax=Oribacterium sp. WCC10 TaxID=1855343 RepID=UPI0008E07733|nr:hypothetical protein [Oribacterium sp. WCC10]SFG75094.1 hypothetical protein SAMN05216356_12417 [Oribacterium sp. WCC10]
MFEAVKSEFILHIPEATLDNYFTPDVVVLVMKVVILVAGLCLIFLGYRYVFTIAAILFGCLAGYIGIRFLDGRITQPPLLMFMFVMFVFLMECFLYGIYSLGVTLLRDFRLSGLGKSLRKRLKFLNTDTPVNDVLAYISPFVGSAIVFYMVSQYIYRNMMVCGIVSVGLAITGFFYQKKKKRFKRVFHTYDDIYFDR